MLKPGPGGSGPVGTFSDLARAVYCAVESSPICPNAPSLPRATILNLSLGWINPAMGGDQGGDIFENASEKPGAAAIYEVLKFARCRDAAIFAAAGNEVGPVGLGFIYPSEWSADRPPNLDWQVVCLSDFDVPAPRALRTGVRLPLVSVVGAVGRSGRPLAISRESGIPELVAYGLTAVAPIAPRAPPLPSHGAGARTAVLSGTSVSAAVASAAGGLLLRSGCASTSQDAERLIREYAPPAPLTTPSGRVVRQVKLEPLLDRLKQIGHCAPLGSPSAVRTWAAHDPCPTPGSPNCAGQPSMATAVGHPECGPSASPAWAHACRTLQTPSVQMLPSLHPQPAGQGGSDPTINQFGATQYPFKVEPDPGEEPAVLELNVPSIGTVHAALGTGLAAQQLHEITIDVGLANPVESARVLFLVNGGQATARTVRPKRHILSANTNTYEREPGLKRARATQNLNVTYAV